MQKQKLPFLRNIFPEFREIEQHNLATFPFVTACFVPGNELLFAGTNFVLWFEVFVPGNVWNFIPCS
jgi:hypothetical protein